MAVFGGVSHAWTPQECTLQVAATVQMADKAIVDNCRIVASLRNYTAARNPKGVFPFLQLGLWVERLHGIRMRKACMRKVCMRKACILSLVLAFWHFAPLRQTVRSSRWFFVHLMHGKCLHVPYIGTRHSSPWALFILGTLRPRHSLP